MILMCLDILLDDERLNSSRSVRLSNNKVSFGPINKKLLVNKFSEIFKHFSKIQNFSCQIKKYKVLGANSSFLFKRPIGSTGVSWVRFRPFSNSRCSIFLKKGNIVLESLTNSITCL